MDRARRLRHSFHIETERRSSILGEIEQNSALGANYVVLVVLSCIIATFGLVQNSAAVIIGAMLIAPLMGPILAFSVALIHGEPRRAVRALGTLVLGASIAVGLSAGIGRLVSVVGTIDLATGVLPSEILSRTQPSLFDLVVALAGGTAAAYALVRPHLSAALAGVAISTALMPPLCVVGIGLSIGNLAVWGGALVLFLTNFVAIVVASSGIFALMGLLPDDTTHHGWFLLRARFINVALLIPMAVLLTVFTVNAAQQAQRTATIRETLVGALSRQHNASLVGFDEITGGSTDVIVATLRSARTPSIATALAIERALVTRLRERLALKLLIVPVTSLDPLNPPTLTPILQSRRGPPLTPVAPGHPTLFPAHAASPSPTTTAAQSPAVPTPHLLPATAMPTANPMSILTATRTAIPMPTATLTPTATPVSYAVVGATGGLGVYANRRPGFSAHVAALPDGAVVQRTGNQARADGLSWAQVVLPDGRVVWIAQAYLVPRQQYFRPRHAT